jgi:two-component system nitrate/nitrite response regulator NarL
MVEAIKFAVSERSENSHARQNSLCQTETILLCRKSLLSIGLKHLLEGTRFAITGSASGEALPVCNSNTTPTLFIIDGSDTPDHIIAAARMVKDQYPDARIAVIADSFELSFIKLARSAGVEGFCLSTSEREVLTKSFELVMLGETVLPTSLMTLLVDMASARAELEPQEEAAVGAEFSDPRLRKLSSRENEILQCLTEGTPNKVIARKLDVAEATVKVHIKAILRKIGAANRTQAAMWATTHRVTNTEPPLQI